MRLNRIDICSISIDFILVDLDWKIEFYRPFCFATASFTRYITRYLLQNMNLDVRHSATVSLHVDLHKPYPSSLSFKIKLNLKR